MIITCYILTLYYLLLLFYLITYTIALNRMGADDFLTILLCRLSLALIYKDSGRSNIFVGPFHPWKYSSFCAIYGTLKYDFQHRIVVATYMQIPP